MPDQRKQDETLDAVEDALKLFEADVDKIFEAKGDDVDLAAIVKVLLTELSRMVPNWATGLEHAGSPVTKKVLNALIEYRDAKDEDRY